MSPSLSKIEVMPADGPGRRERSKAANREAILISAARVFALLGFEAATVRDIIRGTDLAAGTFYNYFKSKEEVFEALAEDRAQRFLPRLRTAGASALSFEDYLRRALTAYFSFVAHEYDVGDRPLEERRPHTRTDTPGITAVYDEVRKGFQAGIKRGVAPPADPDFLTGAFMGMASEIAQVMMTRRPVDIEAATTFALSFMLRGIEGACISIDGAGA